MFSDLRPRRQSVPKPPPYSEAPPEYHTIHETGPLAPRISHDVAVNASLERHRDLNERHVRVSALVDSPPMIPVQPQIESLREIRSVRRHSLSAPSTSPPAYVSVIRIDHPLTTRDPTRFSPIPGTSADFTSNFDPQTTQRSESESRRHKEANAIPRDSPHPSLMSEIISVPNNVRVNRTFSDRTNSRVDSPDFRVGNLIRRTTSINIGMAESASPVTCTTQEETNRHHATSRRRQSNDSDYTPRNSLKGKSRIPRRVPGRQQSITENSDAETKGSISDPVPGTSRQQSDLIGGLFSGDTPWPETPPLISSTAAARSSKRKAILERLKSRRMQSEEDIV